jgi:Protein of unknown function (DUF3300)
MNMKLSKQVLIVLICCLLVRITAQADPYGPTDQSSEQSAAPAEQQSPEELQQLVAPIALYPDALVAQVLAASTYPTEIVEADRWMQSHSGLKGKKLAEEVNKQHWDPSVKALTQFPSVLANMDKNLSWTSSVGDAYVNQQQDVMDAVQVMRRRAQTAGNLSTSPQETVATQGQTIVIDPVNPDLVYVPQYDPWIVYGAPLAVWPDWYPYPGLYLAGPGIGFGLGFGLGFFAGYGWGWHNWGFDWRRHTVIYNHTTYISHSRTFVNHNNFNHARASLNRGNALRRNKTLSRNSSFHGSSRAHAQSGTRSSAFSGFDQGGSVRAFSSRGRSSFGGGFRGGGARGGGGRR